MKNIKTFFAKYERWFAPIALIGGFVIDNFTLRRSDLFIENLLLCFYFLFLSGAILVWHKMQSKPTRGVRTMELESLLFLVIQFIFGGLFSALTVFYIKSASFLASWPFLLILFGGMIATEYFKKHFSQFIVQVATLYLLLFTYLIVVVPLLTRSINEFVFVMSAVISLVVIGTYLFIFRKIVPYLFVGKTKRIAAVILAVFVSMNALYFMNLIPPIPLALRDSGVYKNVVRAEGEYRVSHFHTEFSFRHFKKEYVVVPGSPVYFYSSVFAPIKFQQDIVHLWQKKNAKGDWVTVSSIRFPISGGNDAGYRGYSVSSQVVPGHWRVLVQTSRGQVMGGETFVVR